MYQHLHGSVLAVFLESHKTSGVKKGDMIKQEEGKVYARGQIFNAELRNLKEI